MTPPSSDPANPWTYEQLTDAAKKVKAAGAARYSFLFGQWDTYFQMQPVGVSAGGGNGLSPSGKVDFSNPGWQKALTWYHNLFADGLSPRGITNDKNGGLFQTGAAALMVSGPQTLRGAVEGKLNFGVAAAPYFAGGKKATSTDSWGVSVSAKSKHPDAARKLLKYLTINPVGNAESAEVVETVPTNKTAFQDYVKKADASAGAASANFGTIMKYQLEHTAVHRPNIAGYSVFEPGANKMFSDIRNGADPKTAAAKADKDIQEQIARLR